MPTTQPTTQPATATTERQLMTNNDIPNLSDLSDTFSDLIPIERVNTLENGEYVGTIELTDGYHNSITYTIHDSPNCFPTEWFGVEFDTIDSALYFLTSVGFQVNISDVSGHYFIDGSGYMDAYLDSYSPSYRHQHHPDVGDGKEVLYLDYDGYSLNDDPDLDQLDPEEISVCDGVYCLSNPEDAEELNEQLELAVTQDYPMIPLNLYIENNGLDTSSLDEFDGSYRGHYESRKEMAEELYDDVSACGDDNHRQYFDYDAFGRDLLLGGDMWESEGHYFWSH